MKQILTILTILLSANANGQTHRKISHIHSIIIGYECALYFEGGEYNIIVGNYENTKSIKRGDYIWLVDFNDSFFKSKNEILMEMGKWITQYYNQYVINGLDTKENRRGFILGFIKRFSIE